MSHGYGAMDSRECVESVVMDQMEARRLLMVTQNKEGKRVGQVSNSTKKVTIHGSRQVWAGGPEKGLTAW